MAPERLNPIRVGAALSITVALGYALCAVAWAIWTEPAMNFLNALFHGLDFRRIAGGSNEYGPWLFLYPLLVMSVWGFIVGALFATISNFLHVGSAP
jgi:hypothetical protein